MRRGWLVRFTERLYVLALQREAGHLRAHSAEYRAMESRMAKHYARVEERRG